MIARRGFFSLAVAAYIAVTFVPFGLFLACRNLWRLHCRRVRYLRFYRRWTGWGGA